MEKSQHQILHQSGNGGISQKRGEKEMKLTRILPKFLAKTYQQEDLRRTEIQLQYHQGMVRVLEERVSEGREELQRLERKSN